MSSLGANLKSLPVVVDVKAAPATTTALVRGTDWRTTDVLFGLTDPATRRMSPETAGGAERVRDRPRGHCLLRPRPKGDILLRVAAGPGIGSESSAILQKSVAGNELILMRLIHLTIKY